MSRERRSEALDDNEVIQLIQGEVGFSGEVKAHHRLLRGGFHVIPSPYFVDEDTNKEREIDLIWEAAAHYKKNKKEVYFSADFICDVKTSSAPTILFTSECTTWDSGMVSAPFIFQKQSSGRNDRNIDEIAMENTYLTQRFSGQRIARVAVKMLSAVERTGKNRFESSLFRESMYSVTKAARNFWNEEKGRAIYGIDFEQASYAAKFFLPVVLIDGPLKEFFYEEDRPVIKDIDFRLARFDMEVETEISERSRQTRSWAVMYCQIDHVVPMTNTIRHIFEQEAFYFWATKTLGRSSITSRKIG